MPSPTVYLRVHPETRAVPAPLFHLAAPPLHPAAPALFRGLMSSCPLQTTLQFQSSPARAARPRRAIPASVRKVAGARGGEGFGGS